MSAKFIGTLIAITETEFKDSAFVIVVVSFVKLVMFFLTNISVGVQLCVTGNRLSLPSEPMMMVTSAYA
jgi:hypothetical protein